MFSTYLFGFASATFMKGQCPNHDSGFTKFVKDINLSDLDSRWFYLNIDKDIGGPKCLIADAFSDIKEFQKLKHKD